MSFIPQELRDQTVMHLENAIADRDRKLAGVRNEAQNLRRALGELEGDIDRQKEALRQLESELRQLDGTLTQQRRAAHERLERLRARSEQQRQQLEEALQRAERRHREEWQALQSRIENLAHTREQRERQIRDAGRQALARAERTLTGLNRDEIEVLDLSSDLVAAQARLDRVRTLSASPDTSAAELLSAGRGAEEVLLLLEARLDRRRGTLDRLSSGLAAEADWLLALLAGGPMLQLPDQTEPLQRLLAPERRLMEALIDTHVRAAANNLRRWNGHAARTAQIEGARDILGAEILRARKALPGAVDHEELRYLLPHIWDDLVLRFGVIRYRGGQTAGAWASPEDQKSTYFYFLESAHGEVTVEVPWSGSIVVRHEGQVIQTHPLIQEPDRDAVLIGELAGRWRRLATRLENPHWTPDLAGEGDLA